MTDPRHGHPGPAGIDAVILAGGRASRLGGLDKTALVVEGARLVDHAIDAAGAASDGRIVLVGPQRAPASASENLARLMLLREDPPFGGPVAALAAGLAAITAPLVLVLAADLPRAGLAVSRLTASIDLLRAGSDDTGALDGIVLVDDEGRDQWLTGFFRARSLRSAIDGLAGGPTNTSLRAVMVGLRLRRVPGGDATADIDTWDDVTRFGAVADDATGRHGSIDEGEGR